MIAIGRATTNVLIDLAARRKARETRVQKRLDEGVSPTLPELRAAKALLCDEKDARKIAGAEARQVIARGTALLREAEGAAAADEWLVQCMSVIKTIGE